MYHILRCPGCRAFTYVDRFQKWKLCPVCGHAYEVAKVPAYLEVEDYHEAEQWKNTCTPVKKRILPRKSPRNCAGIMPNGSGKSVTKKCH